MSQFIRGHVIELMPNNKQASHFAQASGVARLSYNWALTVTAYGIKVIPEANVFGSRC